MFKKLAGLTAIAGLSITGTAFADIATSAHNFAGEAWTNEICIVCHTTHNTDTNVSDAPLWNHTLSTSTGFTPYDSTTLNATIGTTVTGISRLCLSCHDGTVAVDSFGGAAGGAQQLASGDAAYVGKDLRDDHPIGFAYTAALATADTELFDPTSTASGLGANIDDDMLFGAASDQVECASCHDVHDDTNAKLLIKANGGSALCLTCHNK